MRRSLKAGGAAPLPAERTSLWEMAEDATQEQVLEAARSLEGDEFTREDVAEKLGTDVSEMRPGWKAAKQANRLEKVREDGDKRFFRVVEQ